MRHLFFVSLFSLIAFFSGCDGDATLNGYLDDANITEDEIMNLEINVTDNGYFYLESRTIETAALLNSFLTNTVSRQSSWDDQADFNDTLTDANVDFNAYRIVLMCVTLDSSNTTLLQKDPVLDDDDNPIIAFTETLPTTPNYNLTPYCYAYRVSKNEGYTQIEFTIGTRLAKTVKF